MPKLANLLGGSSSITIPVPDDDDLVVYYHRPLVTPIVLQEMADLVRPSTGDEMHKLGLCYQMAGRLIESWNLEDADGPIPVTPEALTARMDFQMLMTIVQKIGQNFMVDPQKGDGSAAGSSTNRRPAVHKRPGDRPSRRPLASARTGGR